MLLSAPILRRMFQVLMIFTGIANIAFILGWRFRRTGRCCPGHAALGTVLPNSWSMIYIPTT